jgi:hypothetical protein
MNRMLTVALLTLGLSMAAGEARAAKLEYNCDTTPDHFSELKLTQPGPAYAMTGSMTARGLYRGKDFATIGSVNLAAADDSWSVRVALTGVAKTSDKILVGQLRVTRNGKTEEVSFGAFNANAPVPFALTLDAAGNGRASLGGQTLPVPIKASGPVTASVICSTGEFLFTDLEMGQ